MTTYLGSCHCGAIRFELDAGAIDELYECNCSRCRRVGWLLWFGKRAALRLTTPESALSTYRFHKKLMDHHFCATCGIAPFSEADDPKTGERTVAVNARCLDDFDFYAVPSKRYDGAAI